MLVEIANALTTINICQCFGVLNPTEVLSLRTGAVN